MKPAVRIKENLELQPLWSIENPPGPRPRELPSLKFEREQIRLDRDKAAWKRAMIWGMFTVGK